MKRTIALSFLLFANAILLVHAAIPHHHHTVSTVCFPSSQCADNEEAHPPAADSCCHHNNESQREECPLKEMYVRPENNNYLVDLSPGNDLQYPALFLFSTSPTVEITGLKGLPFRQKPYLQSYYTDCISQSIGLRAPPVC